jgi:tetratricopeptide (TPR) repeat protein
MGQNGYERAKQIYHAGQECFEKGDFDGALENFSKALELLPEDQAQSKARLHNNRGHIQVKLKRYDDALSSFGEAAEVYDKLGDRIGLGEQIANIGSVFRDREEWDAALENYSKSLSIFNEVGHTRGVADQYSNIAYAHVQQARFKSAFELFRKAKALYDEVGEQMKSQLCDQNMQALTPHIEK